MKLIVVALTFVVTAFAARGPEEGFREPTVDSGETAEQKDKRLKDEKLQKQALRRAFLAAERAKTGNVSVQFKPVVDPIVKQIVVKTPSGDPVAGEEGPEIVSAEQREAIVAAGKPDSFFDVRHGSQHPLSSLELVESELSRNQSAQKEISAKLDEYKTLLKSVDEAERIKLQEHYEVLDARYEDLKQQEEFFLKSKELLALCKDNSSIVTFTDPELRELFTFFKFPSDEGISQESLESLKTMYNRTSRTLNFLSNVKEEASGQKGKEKLTRTALKDYLNTLSGEQRNVLQKYLSLKLLKLIDGISGSYQDAAKEGFQDFSYDELKDQSTFLEKKVNALLKDTTSPYWGALKGDFTAVSNERDEVKIVLSAMKLQLERLALSRLKTISGELKLFLNQPSGDLELFSKKIANFKTEIRELLAEVKYKTNVSLDEKALYKELIKVSENDLETIKKIELILPDEETLNEKEVSVLEEKTFTVDSLKKIVDTLLASAETGPGFQKFMSSEILNTLDASKLTPEQKQFVRKIVKQTETFANLKAQATQAIDANDVVRMQELQDELRDVYEDVMRNSWKEDKLVKIDSDFLVSMRNSINDLLQQFSKKAESFTSAAMNKKSFADRVKYRFKRLFVRATIDPRKMRYRSEFARDSNLRLDLVDFKKAATDGYVTTVKSGIDGYGKNLKTVNKAEGDLSRKLASEDEQKRAEALSELSSTLKTLETQIDSAKVVQQQLLVLKGIADCDGTLTYKKVKPSLSMDIPDGPRVFLERMKSTGQGHRSTFYKESAHILLEQNGSPQAKTIIESLKNNKDLDDEPQQKEFLSKLYVTWRGKIGDKLSLRETPDRTDLLLVALLQSKAADAAYLAMLRSPVTGGYVLDAYINRRDVTVPSDQAKTIGKQLQGAKDLDTFVRDAENTVEKLQKLVPPVVVVAPAA